MKGRVPGTRIGPQKIFNRASVLGEALEVKRIEKGLTFAELAKLSGVSRRTLLSIANDPGEKQHTWGPYSRRTGRHTLNLINNALGCRLQDLAEEIKVQRSSRMVAPESGRKTKGATRIPVAPVAIAKGATSRHAAPKGRRR
jgi:DNA-binding XRE family transcriptional regulator